MAKRPAGAVGGGGHTQVTMQRERESPEIDREPEGPSALMAFGIALAGAGVLALLVVLIDPLRDGFSDAISGDTEGLREDLRGLGAGGALIVLVLGLVHAFVWYPAEILDAAVGFVYDFWVAFPLVMAVWVANAWVAYWIGRYAARPILYRFIGRERFERGERVAERGGVTLLLSMRLIPIIPFSLFSYVAGAARVPVWRFTWTTIVGYIPITAIFVYLGSRLEELSPTDPLLWAGAAVMILLVLLTHRVGRTISSHSAAEDAEAEAQETASTAASTSSATASRSARADRSGR